MQIPFTVASAANTCSRNGLGSRTGADGRWSLASSIRGEQPAAGGIRETAEETKGDIVVERLVSVAAKDLTVCPNGDQVYWLDLTFRCRGDWRRGPGRRRRIP